MAKQMSKLQSYLSPVLKSKFVRELILKEWLFTCLIWRIL